LQHEFVSGGTSNLELHVDNKSAQYLMNKYSGHIPLSNLHGAVTPLSTAIEQSKRGNALPNTTWNFLVLIARIDEAVKITRKKKGTDEHNDVITRDCHVFDRSLVSGTQVTAIVLRLWDCIIDAPSVWVPKNTVCLLECVSLHEFNGTYSIKISKASSIVANPQTDAAAQLYGWFTNNTASAAAPPAAPVAATAAAAVAAVAAPLALPKTPPSAAASATTADSTQMLPKPNIVYGGSTAAPLAPPLPPAPPLAEVTEQFTIEEARTLAVRSREQPDNVSYGYMIVALSRVYTYVNTLKFTCAQCGVSLSASHTASQACANCGQTYDLARTAVTLTFKVDLIDTTGAMIQIWLAGLHAANALGLDSPHALFSMTPDQRQAVYNDANFERIQLYFSMQNARFRVLSCARPFF
jgi:ribosomal protein S27AE